MRKSIRNWTNTASDKKESRKGEGNLILNRAMAAKKKKKKAAKKKEELFTFKNREGVEYVVYLKSHTANTSMKQMECAILQKIRGPEYISTPI